MTDASDHSKSDTSSPSETDRPEETTRTRTRTRRGRRGTADAGGGERTRGSGDRDRAETAPRGTAGDDESSARSGSRDQAAESADAGRDAAGSERRAADGGRDAGGDEGPKRRRRGRRGRGGRGRRGGSGGGAAGNRSSGDAKDSGGGSGGAKGSASKGSGGGKGSGSKGAGGGKGSDGDAGGAATQDNAHDREVREAMAKGGTRAAAKKSGGRNGSRGSSGGRPQRPGGVSEEVRRALLEGPPRTMLVTSREDRTQIGVLEERTVVEHYVTRNDDVTLVGNIYMARVQNVLPGMEAAFLDIGKGRNGVLYAGEVLYDELDLEEGADERIENALKPGQTVLVQVTKDPMGSKGPRLTMHLSLAGRFMVLAPNSELFGISRKLTDKERDRLRKLVKRLKPDEHGVIVRTAAEGATEEQVTADLERLLAKWSRVEERAAEAKALSPVYEEPPLVVKVIRDNFGPEFVRCIVDSEELYQQVREYLAEVAPELLDKVELYGAPTADARTRAAGAPPADPDDPDTAAEAAGAAAAAAPPPGADGDEPEPTATDADTSDADTSDADSLEVPDAEAEAEAAPTEAADADTPAREPATADGAPAVARGGVDLAAAARRRAELPALFDAYDVTEQLRKAMNKKVWLPSGGYLIIETTEAMKVVDVNTGKFTGDADTNLEEVVLKTNLEAAEEIVRQLRLRDIGGIIIIDFIDMLLKANQEQVVRRLKRELLRDRTKTRVSDVSQLGLVQMTRKNVSQGLLESFSRPCDHCGGRGWVSEIA